MDILTRQAILNFSKDFHQTFLKEGNEENYISSPLGLWLLVALQGAGRRNEALEAFLGTPSLIAYETAVELIKTAPEDLHIATGFWINELLEQNIVNDWIEPFSKELVNIHKTLPTKEELDIWADENTKGIIKEFPMEEVKPDLIIILANALAVKIDWDKPFDPLPVSNTKLANWGVKNVLHEDFTNFKPFRFYRVDEELYCSYTKNIRTGINVTSVIATNPTVNQLKVVKVAEMITNNSLTPLTMEEILLLEGEESEVLSITRRMTSSGGKYGSVVLPAWDAKGDFDLKDMPFEFGKIIAKELTDRIEGPHDIEGHQSAVAKFHKAGFEAAAITYFANRAGAIPPMNKSESLLIRINFTHSFAAIAYYEDDQDSIWNNLPIFSSWIEHAAETELNTYQ